MTQVKKSGNLIAIITMCFIFAMISFVTNMAAPFGNIWGFQYSWAAMMGNMMNFAAYLFMGIPAGKMLVRYGYKKTALSALAVGAVGLIVQYLSSIFGADIETFTYDDQIVALNLIIYLLGAFICGFCVCMLNTVVNPMLNLLGGGGNKGNQLIQIGGTLNSLTGTLTPLLVGVLIGQVTAETSMSNVAPLLFIGIGIFILSFIIISFVAIPEPQANTGNKKFEHSPLAFRHCLLGVIAIFFYVGVEIGIPAQLNFYITNLGFEGSAAIGGTLAASYWFLMLIGRASSSIISGKISTTAQMTAVSLFAIIMLLIAILMPETVTVEFKGNEIPMKCFLIAVCGLSTSVMWGGIFNLAVEGLGKYTAAASGLFMMMVVGGGIMPLIQDFIAKATNPITSYWLIIAMLVYILYYSKIGCKNVNKDIPVE
ncbi:MFS transporter [Bacteroides sp. AN502(2024)]|uniref:MFS transporter n=1 Tax=Bacteroides sp. AN502(2024) TaxID=3160599 RepID=UPI0035169ECD